MKMSKSLSDLLYCSVRSVSCFRIWSCCWSSLSTWCCPCCSFMLLCYAMLFLLCRVVL